MNFQSSTFVDQNPGNSTTIFRSVRTTKPLMLLVFSSLCMSTGCNFGAQRHNTIGRQALDQGQFSTAVNEFQKAINLNPRNADAFYNLGASYYAMGKQSRNAQWTQQAEQYYRQAISINDQHVDAHRGLASLLIETNQEKYAFDLINTWKNRYPTSTEPVVELARLYQEYGDNRRATDLLSDALKLDPDNVRVLKAMGHVREIQGETHLALDNYLWCFKSTTSKSQSRRKLPRCKTNWLGCPIKMAKRIVGGVALPRPAHPDTARLTPI